MLFVFIRWPFINDRSQDTNTTTVTKHKHPSSALFLSPVARNSAMETDEKPPRRRNSDGKLSTSSRKSEIDVGQFSVMNVTWEIVTGEV